MALFRLVVRVETSVVLSEIRSCRVSMISWSSSLNCSRICFTRRTPAGA